jgi:DNA-3-methyladenine glycosylase I
MSQIVCRCPWANADPLSRRYHDTRWGKPCHDEHLLFKMLILEGKQAGLAWLTILRKWETLCAAFDDFEPAKLVSYDETKIADLLSNPGIIRNRRKITAAVENAKAYYRLCEQYGSLNDYIWSFTDYQQIVGKWETPEQVPLKTPMSDEISRELKRLGFKFVGPTIIYSYLQAIGVVNDHIATCDFKGYGTDTALCFDMAATPMMPIVTTLRREKKSDYATVERIVYRAFLNTPHASGDEALLVRKLRSDPAFVPELDFVVKGDGRLVGNIMYSRSKVVGDEEWETLTLAPVSILPACRRKGFGKALIKHTLNVARDIGFRAVFAFGQAEYYLRFGFKPATAYGITTADMPDFPAFMALPLYGGALDDVQGRFRCADLFSSLDKAESAALNAKLAKPMDIDEYIGAQLSDVQPFLRWIRATIHFAAPRAVEKFSWQTPTFWFGESLLRFAAFKKHIGIFPGSEALAAFAKRLTGYRISGGAIQFPLDKPIDYGLIADIARWRMAQLTYPRS